MTLGIVLRRHVRKLRAVQEAARETSKRVKPPQGTTEEEHRNTTNAEEDNNADNNLHCVGLRAMLLPCRLQLESDADWLAREPAPFAEVDDDNHNAMAHERTPLFDCRSRKRLMTPGSCTRTSSDGAERTANAVCPRSRGRSWRSRQRR